MGITLKAARVNKNLTQIEAATLLGVSRDTLANWEIGRSFPNVLNLKTIESVYDVTYNDLIFLPKNNA